MRLCYFCLPRNHLLPPHPTKHFLSFPSGAACPCLFHVVSVELKQPLAGGQGHAPALVMGPGGHGTQAGPVRAKEREPL